MQKTKISPVSLSQGTTDVKKNGRTSERNPRPVFNNYYGPDGDRPLEKRIVHSTIYKLPTDKVTALHFHDTIEIGLCISGHGECHTEGGITDTFPGDAELFFPYEPHLSRSKSKSDPSTWRFIQIEPTKLYREAGYSDYCSVVSMIENEIAISGVISEKENPHMVEIIRKIVDEAVSDRHGRYAMITALLNELIIIDARSSAHLPVRPRRTTNPNILRLKPALDYVNQNYCHDIKIDRLAELCRMSVTQLRACFRSVTGATPKEYITQARINSAELLLTSTDHTILEIALETGFGDVSGFYRAFVAKTGIPPSDYRKISENIISSGAHA